MFLFCSFSYQIDTSALERTGQLGEIGGILSGRLVFIDDPKGQRF